MPPCILCGLRPVTHGCSTDGSAWSAGREMQATGKTLPPPQASNTDSHINWLQTASARANEVQARPYWSWGAARTRCACCRRSGTPPGWCLPMAAPKHCRAWPRIFLSIPGTSSSVSLLLRPHMLRSRCLSRSCHPGDHPPPHLPTHPMTAWQMFSQTKEFVGIGESTGIGFGWSWM